MTRVVVAIDSFKGSIAAAEAARELAAGWASADAGAVVDLRPMADGGEGTLDAFAAAIPGAVRVPITVTGPAGAPVDASWLLLPAASEGGSGVPSRGPVAVVELASTSGIELLGEQRRGLDADTTGFGQAIAAALDAGVDRLVLGIGSSSSTDGGAGMLRALGARFTDAAGRDVVPGARGLADIAHADLSGLRPLPAGGVDVLSDVSNPLFGARGAAAVFGPQKGLDAVQVAAADAALRRLAGLVPDGASLAATPGAGAAGGTGFGLLAWGARLSPGAREVAALIGLAEAIARADLVITGEGSFDGQSAAGKVPAFVAELAAAARVPVALVAGRIAADADTAAFASSVSLTDLAGSSAASLADPARWLRAAAAALARA
ncbi:glycerate kinase [Microbacterium arborescens]|uniref:glycerate kinase n=1 Tax=Microbacterium arborescens TaxID=33883 RepID=UPI00277FD842|nr:glycerate kinase [Microbacterium arborescens]MDQ1217205.1 glycerate kinase [Microbacterium arborescens]